MQGLHRKCRLPWKGRMGPAHMPNHRDRKAARVLQRVIVDLERSDEPGHPSHQRAIRTLLAEGPLVVPKAVLADRSSPDRLTASAWRAEVIAFLRSIVSTSDRVQQE